MGQEELKFKTLSDAYVFYSILKNGSNEEKELYKSAKSDLGNYAGYKSKKQHLTSSAGKLRQIASAERSKEIAAIESVLGKSYVSNYEESLYNIIETFNLMMNNKDNFLALLDRIETLHNMDSSERFNLRGGAATVDLEGRFPEIFAQVWNEQINTLLQNVAKKVGSNLEDFSSAAKSEIDKHLNNVVELAIKKMFTGQNGKAVGEYEILLKDLNQQSEVFSKINDIYSSNINIIRNYLYSKINGMNYSTLANTKTFVTSTISKNKKNLKSEFQEYVGALLSKTRDTDASDGIIWDAEATGQLKIKPDFITTFGFNFHPIFETLEKTQKGKVTSRAQNIEASKKLQEALKDKKGFIIYSNAKSYDLAENIYSRKGLYSFSDIGFSAGRSGDLKFIRDNLSEKDPQIKYAITGLMNTVDGTIGETYSTVEDNLLNEMAGLVAYMLFDDFDTIGDSYNGENGATAVHAMFLNGGYIPLSAFLERLADAMEKVASKVNTSYDSLLKLEFTPKPLLYTKDDFINNNVPAGAWKNQRDDSLTQQITVHFLAGYEELMANLRQFTTK